MSEAVTVNEYVPGCDGAPDSTPAELRARPGGSEPAETVKWYGPVPPDAESWDEYGTPTAPVASADGAIAIKAKLVRVKSTGPASPDTVAATMYGPPAVALAVKAKAVATPFAPVVAVLLVLPLAKVPDAPEVGAVKVTLAPGTGLPNASATITASCVPKAAPTGADCGVPEATTIVAAAPKLLTCSAREVAVLEA